MTRTDPVSTNPNRRWSLRALGAATCMLAAPMGLRAQPDRTAIRLLVGFPAGGTIDVVARLLADAMRSDLGVPVVVESRPGAGGQLAAQALKAAPPDGRTLLLSPDHTMVMLPLTVREPGFAVATDLAPVGLVARYPGGFAVPAALPVHTLKQFVAWTRAAPNRGNVGVPAPGSIPQFMVDLLAKQTGAPLVAVPYRGSAPLVQDLLGGTLSAGTTALGDFTEHHGAGKLRVIGVIGPARSPVLPDVPTFVEQGRSIDWAYWLGMFAPAGTPTAEIARLNDAIGRALARPEIRERMARIVFEPAMSTPAQLAERIRTGSAYWEPIVRASGWVPQ